jgi:hypothetical protein
MGLFGPTVGGGDLRLGCWGRSRGQTREPPLLGSTIVIVTKYGVLTLAGYCYNKEYSTILVEPLSLANLLTFWRDASLNMAVR